MVTEKRFIILSGPSCVGKGPLQNAVKRFYPGLIDAKAVLCTSRLPRIGQGEIHGHDFYFLPPALICSANKSPDFVVSKVRTDWQAIDLLQIEDLLRANDLVFAEVFYTFGRSLKRKVSSKGFIICSVFLLPLPPGASDDFIEKTMHKKLTIRGTEKEPKLSERAKSAPKEIKVANIYTHRVVNPAGEDDTKEWGEFGTSNGKKGRRKIKTLKDLGKNARWLVETFTKIVKGELPPGTYMNL